MPTCMLFLFTSYVSQLSVEKAMASNATATMADIVARDNVTAEHGIFFYVCCLVVVHDFRNEVFFNYSCLQLNKCEMTLIILVMRFVLSVEYYKHRTHIAMLM